jgi:flagellar biogenesis protein FliO
MRAAHRIAVAAWLITVAASASSLALDPAGGSPEANPGADTGEEQDASVQDSPPAAVEPSGAGAPRSWLARGGSAPIEAAPAESSGTSTGLTLGAVVLVLGLAAAAIAMRFKRQKTSPITPSESRLTVLSSSRVGPKAYAVTAHVNGRVLLLGVTDHSVTNLGWLDTPELDAPPGSERERARVEADEEPDDLPDDYPGSALRASKAPSMPFATSSDLKRFQEVLRGAVSSRELPMRPSYAGHALPDAATTLAEQTCDVVSAGAGTATPAVAVSLRRKRRGRESFAPREPRATTPSRAPQPADASLEGQVAGLRALRNGF